MSKLHRIISLAGIETTGATIGDIVEQIGSQSEGFILCSGLVVRKPWGGVRLSIPMQNLSQAPESDIFGAAITSPHGKTTIALPQGAHSSPSNGSAGTLVPPEAKEDSSTHTKPSTGTSHDAHYASMAVEPVTVSEMMMENEAIPAKARYHAAKAVEYFTRAGRKEGQDWKKEFEKALNHGYRAIHGKWPWETRDH